jgi:hypothetical protein
MTFDALVGHNVGRTFARRDPAPASIQEGTKMSLSCRSSASRSLLLAAALLVAVGCAHSVVVAPKPPPERPAADRIPADVGLYLTKEFTGYKVSESKMGDKWNYDNLGQASATQVRLGLAQIFRTVELVDERPPFSKPQTRTLHAVVEPGIDKFEFDIPFTKFQVYPVKILYKITVYDTSGKVILVRIVEGIGDVKGSPGFDFAENPSKSASKAVEDGANKLLDALFASDEIKRLTDR